MYSSKIIKTLNWSIKWIPKLALVLIFGPSVSAPSGSQRQKPVDRSVRSFIRRTRLLLYFVFLLLDHYFHSISIDSRAFRLKSLEYRLINLLRMKRTKSFNKKRVHIWGIYATYTLPSARFLILFFTSTRNKTKQKIHTSSDQWWLICIWSILTIFI